MSKRNWPRWSGSLFAGVLLLALAACGGKGGALSGSSGNGDNSHGVLPAVNLDGWAMPDMPETIPPQPDNMRELRDRLAPLTRPEDALARESSGVIKTLPSGTLAVAGVHPSPGSFDFRVSTAFNAAAPAELFINGTLDSGAGLRPDTFVQVGLVTAATYEFAMDPDGDPLTNDAAPQYLFNQNALMLLARDASGNPFAAPMDYNSALGIGDAQAVGPGSFDFSLRLVPDVLGGGQLQLSINSGPYGALRDYRQNNWSWWPDEDYSNARLVVMAYSFNTDPAPFNLGFTNVVADDPGYTTPSQPDWVRTWGDTDADFFDATTVAPDGSVYAGGTTFSGVSGSAVLLIKLDPNGNILWRRTWDGAGNEGCFALATDPAGNVYLAGVSSSFGAGGTDMLLLKFAPDGTELLARTWGQAGTDEARAITLDALGDIYLAGNHAANGGDVLLVKLDASGGFVWARGWGGSGEDAATGVIIGSDGNLRLCGHTTSFGDASYNAIVRLEYGTDGSVITPRRVWSGPDFDQALSIVQGEPGKYYVSGSTASFGAGNMDSFVLKFSEGAQNPDWRRVYGGSGFDHNRGLAWDPARQVVYAGVNSEASLPGPISLMIAGFDSFGTLVTEERWQHGSQPSQLRKIAVYPDGSLILGGIANDALAWDWQQASLSIGVTNIGTFVSPGGTATNITTGTVTIPSATISSPAGVIDSGGGGFDALVIKHLPGHSGAGPQPPQPVQVDATALPNASFTIWSTFGPTALTGTISTNSVYDAGSVLGDGDQFYVTFSSDPALSPADLLLYPARPDSGAGGIVTAGPAGLTIDPSLLPYFEVPVGTRTLKLRPNVYNRVSNDLAAGLPDAAYVVSDFNTAATIGGPFATNTSSVERLILGAGTQYQLTFAPLSFPLAGSHPLGNGAAEAIHPDGWPAHHFSVGFASLAIGGPATPAAIVMQSFYTVAGLTATLDSDAFTRIELAPGVPTNPVLNPPYTILHQAPATVALVGSLIAGPLNPAAFPRDVIVIRRGITIIAQDNAGLTTGNVQVQAGRALSGAPAGDPNTAQRNFGAVANGHITFRVLPLRIADDPAQADPAASVTGSGPWTINFAFMLQYGQGPYTVEVDGDYGAAWNDGTPGRVYPMAGSPFTNQGLNTGSAVLNNHSPGNYTIALRVTDAAANQYTLVYPAQISLPASGWTPSLPLPDSSSPLTGWHTSMAIINGNPAIAYFDFYNEDLMFVRALDANGGSWGTPVRVAGAPTLPGGPPPPLNLEANTGWLPSLAQVNGNPAISYVPVGGGNVRYVRASNSTGSAWPAETGSPLIAIPEASLSTSLVVVNGNPAIAAWGGGQIRYRRGNTNGSNWTAAIVTIGSSSAYIPGPVPQVSMAVVNGFAAVAYHNGGNTDYSRATNANGTAWQTPIVADNGSFAANVGAYPSLAMVDGNPAIASYDYTNGALRFSRASTATGAAAADWPASQILDDSGNTGLFPSLAVINGQPALSYWNLTTDSLMYIRALNTTGSSWPGAGSLVDSDQSGDWNSLLEINGQPAISYYTSNGGNLRYIRFY